MLDQYDDDVPWLLNVAKIEFEHGKLEGALDVLDQAIVRDPDNAQAKAIRARIIELKSGANVK